ncbi:MAG: tRNA preQ1(34) S-adenosylmethionine ribosyltransferase-isomerase QueA [Coriobacteriia bacterium]|nr:tRNA preQ1(34) S-adenosylmethionine ribosyltransferase-isomerase QueA [Coriobacteriia bacterium]
MLTDDFDYDLPTGRIAQHPAEPRDSCRLMVLDRVTGDLWHRTFSDLPEYLHTGDVLVVNETRVLPARLLGVKDETGGAVEVLLLRERYANAWECLVKPGRRLRPGAKMVFGDGAMTGLVVEQTDESGGRLVQFRLGSGETTLLDVVHRIGEVPLPPYITKSLTNPELYQTVYARDERSAAAPTAGLHFTEELLGRIEDAGVRIETVELDVGIDTFRPVSEEDPQKHHIHTEHFRVSAKTALAVNEAHAKGGRVLAVGTTSVRALESAADPETGAARAAEGSTSLYILPGYEFRVVDAMVTNFHVPRSTLLMMVSAFAGRERILGAYETAIRDNYRMLSFGDAMLIF